MNIHITTNGLNTVLGIMQEYIDENTGNIKNEEYIEELMSELSDQLELEEELNE